MKDHTHLIAHYPEIGVPLFWPLAMGISFEESMMDFQTKNLKFLEEVEKVEVEKPKPQWATPNKCLYALHTLSLRDFSSIEPNGKNLPTVIIPPYAGHTSIISDFHPQQSLVEVLSGNGINRLFVLDWHSATEDMKDYDIDNYLEEIHVVISDLGGSANIIGLCQGGWMGSLYCARYPQNVKALVLAGAPIDTQAGQGIIKKYANNLPLDFFQELVASGGGLLRGSYMLEGFKSMHPYKQYIEKYADLYTHIDDPSFIKRTETFERWYEYTINLPGKWYVQVIRDLFKNNLFIKGQFVGLGQHLDPKNITCPLYLLAGEQDDITPREQIFAAETAYGTLACDVQKTVAQGGHIGLFMGSSALTENWPKIALWIKNKNASIGKS
jgi:poly(3-hydroxyalkanoate) synthetase